MAKILTLIILIDKEVNLFKKVVAAAPKWTTINNEPRQWGWVKNQHQRHGWCSSTWQHMRKSVTSVAMFHDIDREALVGKVFMTYF